MQRDRFRLFLGVFGLGLAARLLALRATFDPSLVFEKYLLLARDLLAHGGVPREPWAFSPIYTLAVAAALRLGAGAHAILLAQVVAGSIACVLVAAIADRLFGRTVAAIAGIGAAVYGPFLLAAVELESDGLGMLLGLFAVLAAARAVERPTLAAWAITGVIVGLRAIHRPDALLLLLLLPLAQLAPERRPVRVLVMVPFAVLPILPIAWQNWSAARAFIPVTSSGGWVFYTSHNWQARGLSYFPPPLAWQWMQAPAADPLDRLDDRVSRRLASLASGVPIDPVAASSYWRHEGIASMAQRGFAGQAVLEARRLLYMLHAYEGQDDLPLLVKQERLGAFAGGMGLLAPFAVLGLVMACGLAGFWRRHGPWLLPFLALPVLSMCVFYVGARFRLELAALLMPFAAAGLVGLGRALAPAGPGRGPVLLRAVAVVAACALLFNLPDHEIARQRRLRAIQVRTFLGERHGDERELRRAQELALTPAEAEPAWHALAALLRARGDQEGARAAEETAAGILDDRTLDRLSRHHDDPDVLWAVARHHLLRRQPDQAAQVLRRAVRLAPDDPDLVFALATAAFEAGGTPADKILPVVRAAFLKGLSFSTNAAPGYLLEGRCALMSGKQDEARRAFQAALRYDPENRAARQLLSEVSDTTRSASRRD
jgi:tetratricopeptide (TPR) repeat protein